MFGISDTTLAGIIGAVVLGVMMWLGLIYNNQAILGAAMGVVLPVVVAALGILSRSNAVSVKAHDESLEKIAAAEAKARHGDSQISQSVPQVAAQVAKDTVVTEMNR